MIRRLIALDPAKRELMLARKQRAERFVFGLNGFVFLIGAWDGMTSTPPASPILTGTSAVCGLTQVVALVRAKNHPLPERLAAWLAAIGTYANVLATIHHRSGIQYAWGVAAALYTLIAVVGVERFAQLIRKRRGTPLHSGGEGQG
jgi:hypothetical protein